MAEKTSAIRVWSVATAPEKLRIAAPPGYEHGVCAVYGGTPADTPVELEGGQVDMVSMPPQAWADSLTTSLGITEAAQATVQLVNVPAFLWTAYWLPGGTVG